MGRLIQGRVLVAGEVGGEALVGREPLSFWGGYDQLSGEIIDRRHSLVGEMAAGKILAVPFTKGSSTTTAVLLEAVRQGNGPAAVITIGAESSPSGTSATSNAGDARLAASASVGTSTKPSARR